MRHQPSILDYEPRRARGVIGGVRAKVKSPEEIAGDIAKAFEDFKSENDKALADIKKGLGDVVQTEKVDRINAELGKLGKDLDAANAAIAALKVGGAGDGKGPTAEEREHAAAWNKWFRKGAESNLRELEVSAKLTTQSDPDSGYLVPTENETAIDRVLGTVSVIRSLASVIQISTDEYKKLVGQGGAGSGWVGEEEARPETTTPTLREITINTGEIYANPAATQKSLDDARLDVAAWLADEVAITFAEQEGAAFASGDGNKKPRGLLSYTKVANGSYSWGNLGYVASGVAAALTDGSNNGSDKMIELYYALKAGYRNGASWLMSDAVMGVVRKFKDGDGTYLWQPPSNAGEIATFLQKPVYNDDNMPAIGAGAFPIAFGNFKRAYLVVDRMGIRVLRDPYTSKPNVLFYTTKRVGGAVVNFEALKVMKVATS